MSNGGETDLYELLGLHFEASSKEIRKAYKKKALACHPDKNPDNPKAAILFHELSKAVETLLDETARLAYDNVQRAKREARKRHSELDANRKRMKVELEAREAAAAAGKCLDPAEKLARDIKRLQEEGKRMMEEEERNQRQQERRSDSGNSVADSVWCQLKVVWDQEPNGEPSVYNEESLRRIFSKYGEVNAIAVSSRKALVEMNDAESAKLAVDIEIGYVKKPLTISFANIKSRKQKKSKKESTETTLPVNLTDIRTSETLTERIQRQAAERARLIREIELEAEADT